MKDLLITIVPYIFGAGGILSFLLARKEKKAALALKQIETDKAEAESEGAELDNVKSLIEIYKTITEDLRKELHAVHIECAALRVEVATLREENTKLKELVKVLTVRMEEQKGE